MIKISNYSCLVCDASVEFFDNTLTLSRPGVRKVAALISLNAYNFLKIQPNAAKLCEFIQNLFQNNLVGQVVSGT